MYIAFSKVFISPKNENAKIWRYMDLSKFLDIITRAKLFFPRADKLGDPFEGSFPRANVKLRKIMYPSMSDNERAHISEFYRIFKKFTVVSCWHLNESESDAMWKLYLKSDEGVAIQSTFNKLKASFSDKKYSEYIGVVKYLDYNKEVMKPEGSLAPFVHKRKSFEHEHELRVIIQHFYRDKNGDQNYSKSPFKNGVYVPVNLDALIEKIYLAPTCQDWQVNLVESIIKKYRIIKEVQKSPLYDTRGIQY